MAAEKIKWTDEQRVAITHRGSNVFVTASAGTGKTAVLSGRCCDIVSGAEPCSIMDMLVLTFTDAAAEQMRSRIADQIRKKISAVGSDSGNLRSQLILLQGSDISTIHAFCKRLITDYFYKLGIDPGFRLIDEDEQKLLKTQILEKTIEWAWQQENLKTAFEELLNRRDVISSDSFLTNVIKISNFLDGVVSRKNWYEKAVLLSQDKGGVLLADSEKEMLKVRLEDLIGQFEHIKKLYLSQVPTGDWAGKLDAAYIYDLRQAAECLEGDDFDKCVRLISNLAEQKSLTLPRGLDDTIKEMMQKLKKNAGGDLKNIANLAILSDRYSQVAAGSVDLQTKVMIELVMRFDMFYTNAKRSANCLDFSDLEHYGLKLLVEDVDSDELRPSEVALMLQEKYKHIFVDEYQDINGVQQAVLDMLSKGGNVFVVGDAKQSIYAFRGSEPTIFLDNLKKVSSEETAGRRVDLAVNFRSVKPVLDFVNKVFSRIMSSDISQIDYDETAMLKKLEAEDEQLTGRCAVEIDLLEKQGKISSTEDDVQEDETEESDEAGESVDRDFISDSQKQAAMIAKRIKQMVGEETGQAEFEIYDDKLKSNRPVRYGDITILMRSPSSSAAEYIEIFKLAGINVSPSGVGGYFETTEINDCISLLKVLDNPRRDIELAAVLRSPFFKITDEQLTQIKTYTKDNGKRKMDFYESVLFYINGKSGDELAGRLRSVFEQINHWQQIATTKGLADMIWQLYRDSGYLAFVSALPKGPSRRANLLKLHDKAIQFEGFVSGGDVASLSRFVEFIEKITDAGRDWGSAESQVAADDAVRILSVHKSKGLEFPVVFLAEMNHQFNAVDQRADCLYDGGLGLGLRILDCEKKSKFDSVNREIIESKKRMLLLAEEMRILYVALTRAKEKLVLCGCACKNHVKEVLTSGIFFDGGTIAGWQLRKCNNLLDWILYGLSGEEKLHKAFDTCFAEQMSDSKLFDLNFYGLSETQKIEDYINELKSGHKQPIVEDRNLTGKVKSALLDRVKNSLDWQYDYREIALVPAKCSVTGLNHRDDELAKMDYSRAVVKKPVALSGGVAGGKTDSLTIGSAAHLLLSKVNLSGVVTLEVLHELKCDLVGSGVLSAEAGEKVNAASIVSFFQSDLGREVFEKDNEVLREWAFSLAVSAGKWQKGVIALPNSDELD
ncbi:MAG TPA: helicase-exonuclease AddAB subunit AddA, partial [Sedimentisphaerales bacterium]|nr:helicase-exonuclease AddAB subunit AddA [Sedimentisphaerales bacterium]